MFIDADMRLPKDFIELTNKIIYRQKADFITPSCVGDGRSFVDDLLIKRINAYNHRMIRRGKVAGIGGVMIVRKAVHDATDGFPEDVIKDDMGYVERLNKNGATAIYAGQLQAVNSSRRIRQDGVLNLLLGFLPEEAASTRMANRLFRRDIHARRYGHYNC